MKIKQNISLFILCTFLCSITSIAKAGSEDASVSSNTMTKTCVTTAYYSPLAGQRAYLKFNIDAEKKLNGNGTNGADGTAVYLGMVAADKNIPFGSKIYIEGVGLFDVRDRGGAIKDSSTNARVDIWMGHGEEGLAKALTWGSRRQTCTIYLPGTPVPQQYQDFKATSIWGKLPQKQIDFIMSKLNERQIVNNNVVLANATIPKDPEIEQMRKSLFITKTIQYNDKSNTILALNKYLKTLKYDVDEIDEFNIKTFNAIKDFQLNQKIISSINDPGAGYYGPKTSNALINCIETTLSKDIVKNNIAQINSDENATAVKQKTEEENYILLGENKIKLAKSEPDIIVAKNELKFNLTLGMNNDEVKLLQEKLIELKYLNRAEPTNYFDMEVSDAVFEFQKSKGIIKYKTDYGAGWVGPKTRQHINNEILVNSSSNEVVLLK